MKDKQFKL